MIFFLKNKIQCICHNVAAILLHTGWNAELPSQFVQLNQFDCIKLHL